MQRLELALARIREARTTGADILDLGDLPLDELPTELASLPALRVLSLGKARPRRDAGGTVRWEWDESRPRQPFRDLSVLRSLTDLVALDLSSCGRIDNADVIATLPHLTWLSLSGCRQPDFLQTMTGLVSLDLPRCSGLQTAEVFRSLTRLAVLNLVKSTRLTSIDDLRDLAALTRLNLAGCGELRGVAVANRLKALAALNLSGCARLRELNLTALPALHSLRLDGCAFDAIDLRDLPRLAALDLREAASLRSLRLTGLRRIETLPVTGCAELREVAIRRMAALRSCYLMDCPNLAAVALQGVPNLATLDLAECPQLADLAGLAGAASLTDLDLRGCLAVRELAPLRGLSRLRSLNLSGCTALADLAPVGDLAGLASIDLSACDRLGSFAPLVPLLPRLTRLKLAGTTFDDLPLDVYGTANRNYIHHVRAHFADLDRGARTDTERKVFVLGNGGVGKTHLCNRLLGNKYPADPASLPSTHGVQVKEFTLDLEESSQPALVNLWDFGGQDLYHGSHAYFVQRNAVFLLVWSPSHEQGSYDDQGVTVRHRPLAYWLDYVRHVAGTDAPVVVVQAWCDKRDQRRPPPAELPTDFAYLRSLAVSAKTGFGLGELRGALAGAVEELVARQPPPPIGVGRVEVRSELRRKADRTMTVEEFEALCAANGKVTNPRALLSFFHERGVVFYKPPLFDGRVILDQNWALDAIYTLLQRGKTVPLLDRHGRFSRRLLRRLVWQDKSRDDCDQLLAMMQSCGICFRVGRHEYVAPELLPPYASAFDAMLASLRADPDHVGFAIDYPFLHEGVLRGFLSRVGTRAGDNAIYWKYGCWFHETVAGSDVLVESATGDPGGTVTVSAWGGDSLVALRSIYDLFADHGLAVAPPRPRFLNFSGFDDIRDAPPRELTVGPPPVADAARQVYLSYAWGEDTTELGRLREAAARRVIDRLTDAGYHVTYDKKDMRPGDLISAFIRRIGRAENVVAILSRKYLESEYCVKELYLAFCHHQQEPAEFRRAVLPVVLPDAGLLDDAALDGYLAHWQARRERNNRRHGHNPAGRVLEDHQVGHWIAILPMVLGLLADRVSAPVGDDALDAMIDRVLAQLANR